MTDKNVFKYIWCVLTTLMLAGAAYNYLHRTGDIHGAMIGFGCVAVFWIILTVMLVNQFHHTDKAKDEMIKAMAERYHVDPKHITVADRIAYIDYPGTDKMLKINLVSLKKTRIHERYTC